MFDERRDPIDGFSVGREDVLEQLGACAQLLTIRLTRGTNRIESRAHLAGRTGKCDAWHAIDRQQIPVNEIADDRRCPQHHRLQRR